MLFDVRCGGRVERAEIALFDAMMVEISTEKEKRMRKFMRTHEVRNDGKSIRKDKRKAYRKERTYRADCWRGWETVSHYRNAEKIRTDSKDFNTEISALAEDVEYERQYMAITLDTIAELDVDIQQLEYELSDVTILRDRLARLKARREKEAADLRDSEEFIRARINFIKEV